jgi:multidrug resistance efflux pump
MDTSPQAGNHHDQPGVDLPEMTIPDGDNNANHPDFSNSHNPRIVLLVVALLVGVAACLYYYVLVIAPFETTDNAYVQGNITTVAAKVPGYVAEVCVDDNDTVNAGDVLFRIEDADYRARVAQAEAHVRAQASLALAELELGYTMVHAPVGGVVGNRKVRLGRYATPGAALLDVVPVDQVCMLPMLAVAWSPSVDRLPQTLHSHDNPI